MKYSYSFDEEQYFGEYDTPAQAETAAREEGYDEGYTGAWIAENRPARSMLSAAEIGDQIYWFIAQSLYEEIGEVAAGHFTFTTEEETVLGELVLDWIESVPGFNCYGIANPRYVEFMKDAA